MINCKTFCKSVPRIGDMMKIYTRSELTGAGCIWHSGIYSDWPTRGQHCRTWDGVWYLQLLCLILQLLCQMRHGISRCPLDHQFLFLYRGIPRHQPVPTLWAIPCTTTTSARLKRWSRSWTSPVIRAHWSPCGNFTSTVYALRLSTSTALEQALGKCTAARCRMVGTGSCRECCSVEHHIMLAWV